MIEIPGVSCLMFFVDLQRLIWLIIEYNISVLQAAIAYMYHQTVIVIIVNYLMVNIYYGVTSLMSSSKQGLCYRKT